MKRFQLMLLLVTIFIATLAPSLRAAPIGVPGATVGANRSVVGAELNFITDRDLSSIGDVESMQAFAKGEIGLTDRVDLNIRLGFGQFEGPGFDTDAGPAFGVGFKATWAQIPDVNLKIGSVIQTVRIRAEDGAARLGWAEYDAALGLFLDAGSGAPRAGQATLIPYGGVVWSGLDIQGGAAEDDTFGFFLGLATKIGGNFTAGVELRIPDQTAIAINAGFAF